MFNPDWYLLEDWIGTEFDDDGSNAEEIAHQIIAGLAYPESVMDDDPDENAELVS